MSLKCFQQGYLTYFSGKTNRHKILFKMGHFYVQKPIWILNISTESISLAVKESDMAWRVLPIPKQHIYNIVNTFIIQACDVNMIILAWACGLQIFYRKHGLERCNDFPGPMKEAIDFHYKTCRIQCFWNLTLPRYSTLRMSQFCSINFSYILYVPKLVGSAIMNFWINNFNHMVCYIHVFFCSMKESKWWPQTSG